MEKGGHAAGRTQPTPLWEQTFRLQERISMMFRGGRSESGKGSSERVGLYNVRTGTQRERVASAWLIEPTTGVARRNTR